MQAILEEELPGVVITTSSEVLPEIFEHERFSTTVANAVLSPLVGGYVRRLGERLQQNGYDGDLLLLHSGGGVMTPRTRRAVRRAARGLGHRGRRHRLAARRHAVRLRELHRPRHGRHQHGHLARLRRRVARDEGVVGRVRLPHLLPVHRGAHDRRGRRLAGVDRLRGVAAQRAAVRGRRPRAGLLRARRHAADQHRRQPRARPPRHHARRRRCRWTRPRRRPRSAPAWPSRWGWSWTRPRAPSCASPTPTWPTPCG